MKQEIIFDRQGLIVHAVAEKQSYSPDFYEPPQLRFKIVRPYGEVSLRQNYIDELITAIIEWTKQPEKQQL